MAAAVRRQTIERGRDPRDFLLVAYGGAGPMHACEVAAEVGIQQVVVPLFPGHFSAIGMLGVNLRFDRREILRVPLSSVERPALKAVIERMARELETELQSGSELGRLPVSFSYSLALRYRGQDHTLTVPAPAPGLELDEDFAAHFGAGFSEEYLRRYGHLDAQAPVEVVEVEVEVERPLDVAEPQEQRPQPGPRSQIMSRFALSRDPVRSEVVSRAALMPGDSLSGPMVIYEEGATTVLPPAVSGKVAPTGELLLDTSQLRVA